jgi:anaphase-promoting complex subunit 1
MFMTLTSLHCERSSIHLSYVALAVQSSSSQAAPDQHSKNSRVLETDFLNIDVTAPGAILALALIYFGSGSAEIARRLALPQTPLRIDAMRPDLLLYRALGQCLILGEGAGGVDSTEAWLDGQIPTVSVCFILELTGRYSE